MVADGADDIQRMRERGSLTFDIVSDKSLAITNAYGVKQAEKHLALPATYVIDSNGKIVFAHVSVSPKERPAFEEVLSALEAAE